MRKFFKFLGTSCFVPLMLTAITVSATDLDYNLSKSYDIINPAGIVNVKYDIGSSMPYDDVYSQTGTISTVGLSVTSRAITYCSDGASCKSDINKHNYVGWVYCGNAQVDGHDYASRVRHESYRKIIDVTGVQTIVYDIT